MKRRFMIYLTLGAILTLTFRTSLVSASPYLQTDDPTPPESIVKLIFIHHSTGENWLADGYGNLGRELGDNNYYVSDTNYGWGPHSIGDRTDIPDWLEWFHGEDTSVYMDALYNENGQHSSYTRRLSDPGGENLIILFKSCFPNSDLEGNPDDPAGDYEDLTVSGAKFVYNRLLEYFITRPDKLFIVITAPPLSDPSNAGNARAFNNWLVYDWLIENDYPYSNVAVFDFYNVLTHRNAHHWYNNGAIEHITTSQDTLAYPSGDDHPSEAGSQKAADEFIELLNIYYHRWQEGSAQLPPQSPQSSSGDEQDSGSTMHTVGSDYIDDFEGSEPSGTMGWEAYWDEATPSSLSCYPDNENMYAGSTSMRIDFDIAADGWGTCSLFFDTIQDWSLFEGLSFYIRASNEGLLVDVDIYAGNEDSLESYIYTIETQQNSVDAWLPVLLYWSDFQRVDWEENAGTLFANPDQIQGIAIGFSTYEDTPNRGSIWVDNLGFIGSESIEDSGSDDDQTTPESGDQWLCGGAILLPILSALIWVYRFTRRD